MSSYKSLKFFKSNYLWRWTLIGILVGVIAGLGAIIFYTSLEYSTHYFLGVGAGFFPPKAGIIDHWDFPKNPMSLILIMIIGGLISGFLVYTFAPEAEGHGTDAAIRSFHREEGRVRARIPLIKTIASRNNDWFWWQCGERRPNGTDFSGLWFNCGKFA